MGEAKKKMELMRMNGEALQIARQKPIRVVPDLRMENRDGMTFLMLGETEPELCIALTPENCRFLAGELVKKAEANEALAAEAPADDRGLGAEPNDRIII